MVVVYNIVVGVVVVGDDVVVVAAAGNWNWSAFDIDDDENMPALAIDSVLVWRFDGIAGSGGAVDVGVGDDDDDYDPVCNSMGLGPHSDTFPKNDADGNLLTYSNAANVDVNAAVDPK